MAQFAKTKRHAQAGRYTRSMYVWHIVAWDEGPYDATLCERYAGPPYLAELPPTFRDLGLVCADCEKRAEEVIS